MNESVKLTNLLANGDTYINSFVKNLRRIDCNAALIEYFDKVDRYQMQAEFVDYTKQKVRRLMIEILNTSHRKVQDSRITVNAMTKLCVFEVSIISTFQNIIDEINTSRFGIFIKYQFYISHNRIEPKGFDIDSSIDVELMRNFDLNPHDKDKSIGVLINENESLRKWMEETTNKLKEIEPQITGQLYKGLKLLKDGYYNMSESLWR